MQDSDAVGARRGMMAAEAGETASSGLTRRELIGHSLAAMAAMQAAFGPGMAVAQDQPANPSLSDPDVRFSFEALVARQKALAAEDYLQPQAVPSVLEDLDYDDYRNIQFKTDAARWQGENQNFRLMAYPMGWLFPAPVLVNEVVEGRVQPMHFSTDDFNFYNDLAERVPQHADLPGVAGFRLNAEINKAGTFDEVVSFLGASYFRALGRNNVYGLSARGLAINTATGGSEEFPQFTEFWLERPAPGATQVVFHAALDSPSVTGAYRFVLVPGTVTRIDVQARLFFRSDVKQIGVAPLTSMFLFGPNDRGSFDDYRTAVHDSEMLMMDAGGSTFVRPLVNPPRLANSWLGASDPAAFGLLQRNRDFDAFLDAEAHYERRPSLVVEPIGNWGAGTLRLIEIPSELEGNDNIVAFWVPEQRAVAGGEMSFDYRLHWGMDPRPDKPDEARVIRTLAGKGGISGVDDKNYGQKFVVDFDGGRLPELRDRERVSAKVAASKGNVIETVLSRINGTDIWRLVIEVEADDGSVVELRATLVEDTGPDQDPTTLSETWICQWMT